MQRNHRCKVAESEIGAECTWREALRPDDSGLLARIDLVDKVAVETVGKPAEIGHVRENILADSVDYDRISGAP